MKLVYISGPLSGDEITNTRRAIEVGEKFAAQDYAVYIPHLNVLWSFLYPHRNGYGFWLPQDFEILRRCDLLYRMTGESVGADEEVKDAKAHNIPVVFETDEGDAKRLYEQLM
jgi:hypothetical protein